jgi:hypothetical protein
MATIDLGAVTTLADVAKAYDMQGNLLKFVDVLSGAYPFIEEGHWVEANDFTSHLVTQVLTEPTGTFGVINKGTPYESARLKQFLEPVSMLEGYSRIDERLLMIQREPEAFRSRRNEIYVRGMRKTFCSKTLYGNHNTTPAEPHGLFNRYNNASTFPNSCASQGGSGNDTCSLVAIKWGEDGMSFVFPQGAKNFIQEIDLQRQLIHDSDGNPYTAVVSHFMVNYGISVADDRCIQRIARIEQSGSTNIFDEDKLIERLEYLPDGDTTGVVIYVNRAVMTQMRIAFKDKSNVNFSVEEAWGGRKQLHFQGIPVVRLDSLVTETDASFTP